MEQRLPALTVVNDESTRDGPITDLFIGSAEQVDIFIDTG